MIIVPIFQRKMLWSEQWSTCPGYTAGERQSQELQCGGLSGSIGRCWAEIGTSGSQQNTFYIFSLLLDPFPETILEGMQKVLERTGSLKAMVSLQTGINKIFFYVTLQSLLYQINGKYQKGF